MAKEPKTYSFSWLTQPRSNISNPYLSSLMAQHNYNYFIITRNLEKEIEKSMLAKKNC